ncbi:MAG: VanZ family protein [Candidatus Omnitrophota bacterium]|jgi:VanZ family protein
MNKAPERVRSRLVRLWTPVALWLAVIFLLSSIPGSNIPDVGLPNADKVVHFSEFFILGVLLIRAVVNSFTGMHLAGLLILSIILISSFGAVDEWHQLFVSGRATDIFDLAADISGALAGSLFYILIKRGACKCHH